MLAATSTPENPPVALPVLFDNIPDALRDLPQWVTWRYHWEDVRWKKPLFNPRTGYPASSTNPKSWGTLEQARRLYSDGAFAGVGFVPAGNGPVGVDLDHCRNPESGLLDPWAADLVASLNTYGEVSPSGEGLRLFGLAELPLDSTRSGSIEVYQRRQYVTVTGQKLPGVPCVIQPRHGPLLDLFQRVEAEKAVAVRQVPPARESWAAPRGAGLHLRDDELIRRACARSAKVARLWSGDASGYSSPSQADMALVRLLAWWTGPDAGRLDALFRQSGLMRAKWFNRCKHTTYGGWTVDKVLKSQTQFYSGTALLPKCSTAQTEVSTGGGGVYIQNLPVHISVCAVEIPTHTLPRSLDSVERCVLNLVRELKARPSVAGAAVADLEPTLRHWVSVSYVRDDAFTFEAVWPIFVNAWAFAHYPPGNGPFDKLYAGAAAHPDADLVAYFTSIKARWARNKSLAVVATFCRRLQADAGTGPFFLGYEKLTALLGKKSWHVGGNLLKRLRSCKVVRRIRRGTSTSGASLYRWTFSATQKGQDA